MGLCCTTSALDIVAPWGISIDNTVFFCFGQETVSVVVHESPPLLYRTRLSMHSIARLFFRLHWQRYANYFSMKYDFYIIRQTSSLFIYLNN